MSELVPPNIDLVALLGIVFLGFIGSFITTGVGFGGGAVIIGGLSLFLPISVLIPFHAIAQGLAGLTRAYIFRAFFIKRFFIIFTLGSFVGYALSYNFLVTLSEDNLKLILGIGLITLNFLPKFNYQTISKKFTFLTGTVTGFLTVFLGVMGPIVATILKSYYKDRYTIVATIAWCISFQNLGKAALFSYIGFDFVPWLYVIFLFMISSYLGTLLGKKLLDKNNNTLFRQILDISIVVIGFKLIIEALI